MEAVPTHSRAATALQHYAWYQVAPHMQHEWWECTTLNTQGIQPQDTLKQWLGWPTQETGLATLQHLAETRLRALQSPKDSKAVIPYTITRHDSPTVRPDLVPTQPYLSRLSFTFFDSPQSFIGHPQLTSVAPASQTSY